MHRVAFVVDRGFHRLGLHGGVALPFLMGLGCNVPALASTAAVTHGRDRTVASLIAASVKPLLVLILIARGFAMPSAGTFLMIASPTYICALLAFAGSRIVFGLTREVSRARKLFANGDLAQAELDRAEAAFAAAGSSLASIEAQYQSRRDQLALSQSTLSDATLAASASKPMQ